MHQNCQCHLVYERVGQVLKEISGSLGLSKRDFGLQYLNVTAEEIQRMQKRSEAKTF